MKKITAIAVFVLAIIIALSTLVSEKDYQQYLQEESITDESSVNKQIQELITEADLTDENSDSNADTDNTRNDKQTDVNTSLRKSALNKDELKAYDELLKQIRAFKNEYTLEVDSNINIEVIYETIGQDYPEYFWVSGPYSYLYEDDISNASNKKNLATITQESGFKMDKIKTMYSQMMKKANALVASANAKKSDYDKILYVHDKLADKIIYDFDTYKKIEEYNKSKGETKLLLSGCAYNALVKNTAVCSGYSAAFQLVMNKLGYECARISGNNGQHEWNYLKIDGKYYYVDVTWDAPTSDEPGAEKPDFTHDFFCITEKELLMTHTIDADQPKITCNSTDYDYCYRNGTFFETYDANAVYEAIKTHTNQKLITLKFGDEKQAKAAQEDLMEQDHIHSLVDGKSVSWSFSLSKTSLNIFLD